MKTFRFKAPWFLTLVFVVLVVLLSFPMTGRVSAQSSQEQFHLPYRISRLSWGCHPEFWYIGGVRSECAIDIVNDDGDGLLATTNGIISRKGVDPYDNLWNTYLIINGDGCYNTYMLHGIYDRVEVGDRVVMGQRIGSQGNVGESSTGAHTHISVYNTCTGQWVNPSSILTETSFNGNTWTIDGSVSSGIAPVNTTSNVVEAVVSTPQPKPPGQFTIHTDSEIQKVLEMEREELANRVEAPVVTEASSQISEPVTTPQNPLKIFLGRYHGGWWVFVIGVLIYFIINQYTRSLSFVWFLTILMVAFSFFWTRNYFPTFAMPEGVSASVVDISEEVAEVAQEESETIMFPAIPIPPEVVEAIKNPVIQPPQGSSYFPDPGLSMVRTVEILWEIAEERGIPPQILLSKFYYEGCYEYSGTWMFLRNWQPNGSLVRSPSYADCVGIGQMCTYWHPSFNKVKAGDLNDPEAALRYSAGEAANFFRDMYLAEGSWWGAVRRYHGTQAEAEVGYRIIKGLVNESPINPETGRAAWPRAESGLAILNETSLRSPIFK